MSDQLVQLYGRQPGRLAPAGIKFGRGVFAANLIGTDADTGGLVEQMQRALDTMRDVLSEAGASLDNVGRVTAYVATVADREPIYGPWDSTFPDPQDRPAFKVLVAPLPVGVKVRLDMLALHGARRKRIDIAGVSARDPTVAIGNWLFSSRVHGTDPRTTKVAEGLQAEVAQAFANIDTLLQLAGHSPDDITQITLFAPDPANAAVAAEHFLKAFPDPTHRPSFTRLSSFIPPHLAVMLEVIASAGGAAPREVFSRTELTPIPDGVCLDELFFAPAITGEDPSTGTVPDGFEAQLRAAFPNMQKALAHAGLELSNVAHMTVYMQDVNWRPILNQVWAELFPDPAKRPPHKYVPVQLEHPRLLTMLQVFAVRGAQPRVLEIPGMAHGDPMSMGAQTGSLLFSSRIVGTDTTTGQTPADPHAQVHHAFNNARTLLQQAGTTVQSLSQVTAFINDPTGQELTLTAWQAIFPDPATAPSLHFLNAHLPGNTAVRLEIVAAC